jgi:hypothetical protein
MTTIAAKVVLIITYVGGMTEQYNSERELSIVELLLRFLWSSCISLFLCLLSSPYFDWVEIAVQAVDCMVS